MIRECREALLQNMSGWILGEYNFVTVTVMVMVSQALLRDGWYLKLFSPIFSFFQYGVPVIAIFVPRSTL